MNKEEAIKVVNERMSKPASEITIGELTRLVITHAVICDHAHNATVHANFSKQHMEMFLHLAINREMAKGQ